MSPYQHGEVFVTDDAGDDLDLGHYERYVRDDVAAEQLHHRPGVSERHHERKGEHFGHTVQVIPHIADEIKKLVWNGVGDADIAIVEAAEPWATSSSALSRGHSSVRNDAGP